MSPRRPHKGQAITGSAIDEIREAAKMPPGTVSIGPVGIEPHEDGWRPAGWIAEDGFVAGGIAFSEPKHEDNTITYQATVHHRFPMTEIFRSPAAKEAAAREVADTIARALGITLDPWQEQILHNLYPRRVYGRDEREYLKDRLNARLRGEHPGHYERDWSKR